MHTCMRAMDQNRGIQDLLHRMHPPQGPKNDPRRSGFPVGFAEERRRLQCGRQQGHRPPSPPQPQGAEHPRIGPCQYGQLYHRRPRKTHRTSPLGGALTGARRPEIASNGSLIPNSISCPGSRIWAEPTQSDPVGARRRRLPVL
jgi:hypothetical protein